MKIPKENRMTLEEYYEFRESNDGLWEYIDGMVFMSPSPSTKHQRISMRLSSQLFNLLNEKSCEVFSAPFDIELKSETIEDTKVVIPDITVICDKSGLAEQKYVGVPTLIIEIVSPSNQSHDLVVKLNLYMQYGVKEYWIVNPLFNMIQVYLLNEDGQYIQTTVIKETGKACSSVIEGFVVLAESCFE
ncbi:MAG TPA: endonuclease [Bacillus sp. (in: Bacteria)]|uniref:Uma2 family endonuclease n=1 Tax=Anoxybacillus andreesenii TaxID=1325932 RepID=A0ABT9V1G2_9BACL|nr:Uma2 family endonuclease [Robertmurraya andreesenii]MDQ0154727.1 Uma2 family endonuclease [Robertmurraya andreesenii]HCX49826.1 endonuclease [Bacillus sp. (in: firmicutes)]